MQPTSVNVVVLKRNSAYFATAPISPFHEPTHVGAGPNEFAVRPASEHDVEIRRVREKFKNIGRLKRTVGLAQHHEVAGRLRQRFAAGPSVSLPRLEHFARARARDFFRQPAAALLLQTIISSTTPV